MGAPDEVIACEVVGDRVQGPEGGTEIRFIAVAVALAVSLVAVPSAGAVITPLHQRGDAIDAFELRAAPVKRTGGQAAAARRLGARATWNDFGTPHSLAPAGGGWLATGLSGDAVEAAREFIDRNRSLFRVSADDLELVSDSRLAGSDAHAVLLEQRFEGLAPVAGGLVSVGVRDGKVAYASSSLSPDTGLSGDQELLAQEAWRRAAASVGRDGDSRLGRLGHHNGFGTFDASRLGGAQQSVRLAALPVPGGEARRVYEVNVVDDGIATAAWTVYVDAETGEALRRVNRMDEAADQPNWRYFPNIPPIDGADTDRRLVGCFPAGAAAAVPCQLDERTTEHAAHNPWDVFAGGGPPSFTTNGNNADTALSPLNPLAPDSGTVRPTSPTRDYIAPWTDAWRNSKCNPSNFAGGIVPATGPDTFAGTNANDVNAAIISLFANHNNMHDWSYVLGFTEDNWNLQVDNFDHDGEGGDPEVGDAQAGALSGGAPTYQGRDNANQRTLPDGLPGITNMYLWQPIGSAFYPPCVDGDFDMSVIAHEYTHAISNRMVGGPDNNLTSTADGQARAMGESWSDLAAVEFLQEHGYSPADDENPFAVGAYVTGSKQKGIRNYAMNASPLNYSHVQGYDGVGNGSPHDDGEIWSAVNFDIREAFIDKYGQGTAALQLACAKGQTAVDQCPGNRRWMQLVFDSFLLMPPDGEVSMVEARDALIEADQLRFGGANLNELWEAFARRGFGDGASSSNPGDSGDFGDTDDPDPKPSFTSPVRDDESTVAFKPTAAEEPGSPAIRAELFVGDYEANVTPVADTDPDTALGETVELLPGTYTFTARADGHGTHKFTQEIAAGSTVDLDVAMPTNRASKAKGATILAGSDGANQDSLIDDTEETDWAEVGHTPDVAGTKITVKLAGGRQIVERAHVSAMLRGPDEEEDEDDSGTQNRFTALRQFELRSCDGTDAQCDEDSEFSNVVFTSPPDAFPGGVPRPLAPDMLMRRFPVATGTPATHLRLVVLSNQCTGVPLFQDDTLDNDPASHSSCREDNPPLLARTDRAVRAAELQVFSRPVAVSVQPGPEYRLPVCATTAGFRSVGAAPRGRGVRISFRRRVNSPVTVDVVRQSRGRRVGRRLVRRFRNRTRAFTWNGRVRGRRVRAGHYTIGFRMPRGVGRLDQRRVNLQRSRGRFRRRPASRAVTGCGLVRAYGLGRPVFGGTRGVPLGITFRLSRRARVSVVVRHGRRVVRRFRTRAYGGGRRHRLRLSARGRARGDYRITMRARRGSRRFARTLVSRKL
ncbi:MAG TPA: M36 family metallopeptidase [Thermoleophilaceae bacterium]|nr:M36 family metallopeptidase [Thermoleophilaceae bacterium]